MEPVTLKTRDGGTKTLSGEELDRLGASIAGHLISSDHLDYLEASTLWNAMIERRPALVARCGEVSDVAPLVRFAAENDLLMAVRGAGHNIAGSALVDEGIVIDLSGLQAVEVDVEARRARVEPGCTLAIVDAATQAHGLAVPTGINSTTGIAGLTLGGGFGWLSRKHGLTVDSLVSANIVTADGQERVVDEVVDPDLFWAIRGGGGNFGVATSFEFALHPVGPQVLSGLIVHPLQGAKALLRGYREIVAQSDDDLTAWVVLRQAPPLPFLPGEWHGKPVMVLAAFHAGSLEEGERAMKPLRSLGDPIADVISPHPYVGWQQAFDPLLAPGARNYWKSHDLKALSDEAIDTLVDFAGRLPSPHTEIFLAQLGGATSNVPVGATAYSRRDIDFLINVHARWMSKDDDARCVGWAREFFQAAAPYATGGVYVNFMPEDEQERTPSAYGPNYSRLAEIKARYDPDNLFRGNQNIRPSSNGGGSGNGSG